MTPTGWILLVVGAYLALSLAVGWRAGRGTSASAAGYVAGDRSMGGVLMYFVTGATIFSAFAMTIRRFQRWSCQSIFNHRLLPLNLSWFANDKCRCVSKHW